MRVRKVGTNPRTGRDHSQPERSFSCRRGADLPVRQAQGPERVEGLRPLSRARPAFAKAAARQARSRPYSTSAWSRMSPSLTRRLARQRRLLQFRQILQRLVAARSAHLGHGPEAGAHCGPPGPAEKRTTAVGQQLNARNPGRFAFWHARNRRRDRWRDAAGATLGPALHPGIDDRSCRRLKLVRRRSGVLPAAGRHAASGPARRAPHSPIVGGVWRAVARASCPWAGADHMGRTQPSPEATAGRSPMPLVPPNAAGNLRH